MPGRGRRGIRTPLGGLPATETVGSERITAYRAALVGKSLHILNP
jgi:hypothetical protein